MSGAVHAALVLVWWNGWLRDQKPLKPVAPLCLLPQDQMASL